MVHQVAAHHAGAVGDAVRVAFAGGEQQNFRAFNTVGRQDKLFTGDAMAHFVPIEVVHRLDGPFVISFNAEHHRIGNDFHPGIQRLTRRNTAVILRIDRADWHTVIVAATGRAAIVSDAVARLRANTHLIAQRAEALPEAFEAVRQRNAGQRVGARTRRRQIAVAGDAHLVFGVAVVRLQFGVADGPVAPDAVQRVDAHIVRQQAKCLACPVPGSTADAAQVLGAIGVRPFLDQVVIIGRNKLRLRCPRLRREGFGKVAFKRRVAKILHRFVALNLRPGLQHQHRSARFGHLQCRQRTGNPGTNHHHIGA